MRFNMQGDYNEDSRPEARMMTIQVIHLALGTGVFIFGGIVIFHSMNAVLVPEADRTLHEIMAYVSALSGFVSAAMAYTLFPVMIRKQKERVNGTNENRYAVFQQAHLTRMMILEGAAMFGWVALLLYTLNVGPLDFTAEAVLPVIPVVIFFVFWILLYPTEDKIKEATGSL